MASSCTNLGVGGIPKISVEYVDSLGTNNSQRKVHWLWSLDRTWCPVAIETLWPTATHAEMITGNRTTLPRWAAQPSTAISLEFLCHDQSLSLMHPFALHHNDHRIDAHPFTTWEPPHHHAWFKGFSDLQTCQGWAVSRPCDGQETNHGNKGLTVWHEHFGSN